MLVGLPNCLLDATVGTRVYLLDDGSGFREQLLAKLSGLYSTAYAMPEEKFSVTQQVRDLAPKDGMKKLADVLPQSSPVHAPILARFLAATCA